MIVRESSFGKYGQNDAAVIAATTPEPSGSLLPYYLMAVAAGVTVWFITRALGRKT